MHRGLLTNVSMTKAVVLLGGPYGAVGDNLDSGMSGPVATKYWICYDPPGNIPGQLPY
ncbi:unnamed protein product [Arabidopsis halleri]